MDPDLFNVINLTKNNLIHIDKFTKFSNLLEKTEMLISNKIQQNLDDLTQLDITFNENIELFRTIKNNLSKIIT